MQNTIILDLKMVADIELTKNEHLLSVLYKLPDQEGFLAQK